MTLFESASLALMVLGFAGGGAWALIGFYFSMSEKSEKLKSDLFNNAIKELRNVIHLFGLRVDAIERDMAIKYASAGEKINTLEKAVLEAVAEIKSTRESLGLMYRHFAGAMEQQEPTRVKEIAKDVFRVETKKPKGG